MSTPSTPDRPPSPIVIVTTLDDLRAVVRAEVDAALDARAPVPTTVPSLLSASQIARALGVSVATINRLDLPHETIGTRRRYELATCRVWMRDHGPIATTPKPRAKGDDDVDVSGIASRAGLRVVGGRR